MKRTLVWPVNQLDDCKNNEAGRGVTAAGAAPTVACVNGLFEFGFDRSELVELRSDDNQEVPRTPNKVTFRSAAPFIATNLNVYTTPIVMEPRF